MPGISKQNVIAEKLAFYTQRHDQSRQHTKIVWDKVLKTATYILDRNSQSKSCWSINEKIVASV